MPERIIPTHEPEVMAAIERRRGDMDKVATTALRGLNVEGVSLISRYDKAHELRTMAAMVDALPPAQRALVETVYCDSKQGDDFTVTLRSWDPGTARQIGARMDMACRKAVTLHSGIRIQCGAESFDIEPHYGDDV